MRLASDGVTSDGDVTTAPEGVVCTAGVGDTGAPAVGEDIGAGVGVGAAAVGDTAAPAVVLTMAGVGEYAAAVVVSTTVGVVDRIAATDVSNC